MDDADLGTEVARLLDNGWLPATAGDTGTFADDVLALADRLFGLDEQVKQKHAFPDESYWYGWNPCRLPEGRESWQITAPIPDGCLPDAERDATCWLETGMRSVEERCTRLLYGTLSALDLDVPPWARAGAGRCHLRVLRYQAGQGQFHVHHDISVLTVFLGSTSPGLEFKDAHGGWQHHQTPILAGGLLQDVTAERVAAGRHRVLPGDSERVSAVAFVHPPLDTVLDASTGATMKDFLYGR